MFKLNSLLYPNVKDFQINRSFSLDAICENSEFYALKDEFLKKYNFRNLKTFEFSKYGILGLLLQLKGKIAVSLGESEAVVNGALEYKKLGFDITFLDLCKDGSINLDTLKNSEFDYIFISSYVMDTFYKLNLKEVKKLSKAKIISNASAHFSALSNIIYFDCYKLCGYGSGAVLLYIDEFEDNYIANIDAISINLCFEALKNQKFDENSKELFQKSLENIFKDDLYYFVSSSKTLEYSLHFGLKGIKAREIIRGLALNNIFITNGEGCSLGMAKPSRIIQKMGYDELTSRNSILLCFCKEYSKEEIEKFTKQLHRKYKEQRLLNE